MARRKRPDEDVDPVAVDDKPEDDDILDGEFVDLGDDEADVIDTEDGGALVRIGDDDDSDPGDFYKNLADDLPESEMNKTATGLVELITKDKEARKRRDEQYAEGLKRTGLGNEAPGGADFEGASRAVHPMMVEACVDFSARAMKELFPPDGPVKDKVEGDVTSQKLERADRKTRTMNWQLTVQSTEFRAELEQLLTQVPMGGAQYLKVTWDEGRNRPNFLFVPIDDIYLPFAATNYYSSQRKTHVQYLTQLDYKQRVTSGMYRDVDLMPTSMEPDATEAEQANEKIEGKSETGYNEDGLRTIFEIYVTSDLEAPDEYRPYVITIDKATNKVLAIYRNWQEDDQSFEELDWIVEFPFIPWRGAYPIGFPHLIGGLSGAATGALRALLDSAHINNTPGMLKLKGKTGGQTVTAEASTTTGLTAPVAPTSA